MTDIISSRGPPPAPPPHALSFAEDSATEYFSEVDTALNTPTSWTTEHLPTPQLNSRWSLSSSWSSTFSRPASIHNNNHNTNKRNSEFFIPRRSISPKNMNDRTHHRTSLPPNSISTPVPTSGGAKLFSKLAAFSHNSTANSTNSNIIQEEGQQERREKRQRQQSSQPHNNYSNQHHNHNDHHYNGNNNNINHHYHNHNINHSNHHYHNNSSNKINSSQQQQHQHQHQHQHQQRQQQQQQQQQYRMHPHESIRVQRLLGMVYQFQQTSSSSSSKVNNNNHSSIEGHNDDQAFSAFCTQLQTYLESWADLKQGKRHVVRQTKTTILRNQRTSSIRSKRQKRNIADRPSYRQNNYQQNQNSQLSDSDSDSDSDNNYDNDEDDELESANIQQRPNTSHEKLLARINGLEKALERSKYDKNQVEQKLNSVQAKFAVTRQQQEMFLEEEECIDDAQQPSINVDNVDELQKNDISSSPSDNNNIEQQRLVEENNTLKKAIEQQEQSYQEVCTMLTQTQATITELELKLQTANDSLVEKQHITCDCKQTIIAERDVKIQDLEATLQQLLTERQNWEQQAAEKYFHEKETFKVQISREVRELAGALAEQESQMDVLEKRRQQDALTINRIEALKRAAEQKCQKRLDDWEVEEKKLRMTVATLEAKVVKLEQDTLVLYSKNLKLAHQLGQWAP
ncbi:hypothetical protein INT45_000183 [Circinella minor]|uniref:Uncharacterized protein n=1 Tax=Circinella minor TaxID=1195481 RepID=A0A8H7VPM5_9FUNG|nr:hypothetical protein INT45_000183 [Circinella minor]